MPPPRITRSLLTRQQARAHYDKSGRWEDNLSFYGRPAIARLLAHGEFGTASEVVEFGCGAGGLAQLLLEEHLPIGLDIHHVHWMSDVVSDSVNGFFINLAQAVAIVLVVLALSMGWRMGSLIGIDLVLTILGTLIVMAIMGIDLQRMSLGALIIALGMMVDNSIVVAEGFVVRREQGMDKIKAAIEAAGSPSMPLLGATVIAVMAFYPIGGSKESTGEYWFTPESYRLLAHAQMQDDRPDRNAAIKMLKRGVAIAREQAAKGWENRLTADLKELENGDRRSCQKDSS